MKKRINIQVSDENYSLSVEILNLFTELGERLGLQAFSDINGSFAAGLLELNVASNVVEKYYKLAVELNVAKFFKARIY